VARHAGAPGSFPHHPAGDLWAKGGRAAAQQHTGGDHDTEQYAGHGTCAGE
jgi:hypothetical protein